MLGVVDGQRGLGQVAQELGETGSTIATERESDFVAAEVISGCTRKETRSIIGSMNERKA